MKWPYKSTVSLIDSQGTRFRLKYVVSASSLSLAQQEIERQLQESGVSICSVKDVAPVSAGDQRRLDLADEQMQLYTG
jgi:hypothetical protein